MPLATAPEMSFYWMPVWIRGKGAGDRMEQMRRRAAAENVAEDIPNAAGVPLEMPLGTDVRWQATAPEMSFHQMPD